MNNCRADLEEARESLEREQKCGCVRVQNKLMHYADVSVAFFVQGVHGGGMALDLKRRSRFLRRYEDR